jgi:hypothetical protein
MILRLKKKSQMNRGIKITGKFILIAILAGFLFAHLDGQEAIVASGSNATGSRGTVSYTIGQIAFSTLNGTDEVIVQGVQQPYEISVITTVDDTPDTSIECVLFPNPTRDAVKVSVVSPAYDGMTFRLYDFNGVLLREITSMAEETVVPMQNLSPATYILRVMKNNKVIKTFKIIKY